MGIVYVASPMSDTAKDPAKAPAWEVVVGGVIGVVAAADAIDEPIPLTLRADDATATEESVGASGDGPPVPVEFESERAIMLIGPVDESGSQTDGQTLSTTGVQ